MVWHATVRKDCKGMLFGGLHHLQQHDIGHSRFVEASQTPVRAKRQCVGVDAEVIESRESRGAGHTYSKSFATAREWPN